MAERPSVKGAIAKQLDPDGLSVISNCLAIRIIAHYPIPHLLVYLGFPLEIIEICLTWTTDCDMIFLAFELGL